MEDQGDHGPGVPEQHGQQPKVLEVPDADGAVGRTGKEPLAGRFCQQAPHCTAVSHQPRVLLRARVNDLGPQQEDKRG